MQEPNKVEVLKYPDIIFLKVSQLLLSPINADAIYQTQETLFYRISKRQEES